jgi:hypothetical protein
MQDAYFLDPLKRLPAGEYCMHLKGIEGKGKAKLQRQFMVMNGSLLDAHIIQCSNQFVIYRHDNGCM